MSKEEKSGKKKSNAYVSKDIEQKWQKYWLENKTGKWDKNISREDSFIIDTPPPTISGKLHMGHIYSYTQTDIMARFMRMSGKNVFYPMGWDNNGLPTERLVEKQRKIRATDMSREEFTKICFEVIHEAKKDYKSLFCSIGLSVDWDQEYETISDSSKKISQMSVLDLFKKDQLYRQEQPTLWDVADQTALAQAEVEEKEQMGKMWEIPFFAEDGSEIVIATTRPELLGACVALMIHPEHPKAKEMLGKTVTTPLYGVNVPIVADEKVDLEKGTGFVMCCTFGDVTDIEWWKTHKLKTRIIINKYGKMTDMPEFGKGDWVSKDPAIAQEAIDSLIGLKAKTAKLKIVEILTEKGFIRGEQEVGQMVPCGERSGVPLEIIVTQQWFIKVLDKKDALIEQGKKIKWYPEYMRVRFEQWTENLKWDWCISRQRYFGVPIPFWYSKREGEEGKIIPADPKNLPVNPLVDLPDGYTREEVEADPDVFDTWMTSSVSPQLSSLAITNDLSIDLERHKKLYPADLRPQAHEIIRTWAFYTIVKSYLHENTIPWKEIALSGWCLAEDRAKMSKSKGTAIRPEILIEENSADIIRYWTSTSKLGQDTAFDRNIFKIGKRLQNKLWNAAKFVNLQIGNTKPEFKTLVDASALITHPIDKWISTRLAETIKISTKNFKNYAYAEALRNIEDFFWKDLCDNYLELVKTRAYGETTDDKEGQISARITLYFILEATLRLFAPIMPYITEELYSSIYKEQWEETGSIHTRGRWPKAEDYISDSAAVDEGNKIVDILAAVRKAKSNANVSIKTEVSRFLIIGIDELSMQACEDLSHAGVTQLPEFISAEVDGDLTKIEGDNGIVIQLVLETEKLRA